MDMPFEAHDIEYAESLLAAGEVAQALPLLQELAEQADAYAQEVCRATDRRQWFSFSDAFERLAYRRVERDPRELVQLPVPFDRLYAALALAHIRQRAWEPARDALMQAVRWNPMNCTYRLDLAELFGMLGDTREWAALSASVLDRAADARPLGRAYANLGRFFLESGEPLAAEGCRRLAQRYAADDPRTEALAERMAGEQPTCADESDEQVFAALEAQGITANPNAEVAICLLMCASDAASSGDRAEATRLTLRARDLVGTAACEALVRLIRESDAELAHEQEGADAASCTDAPAVPALGAGEGE